jgi:phosphatidylinositol alpha-1,6-mannosyltransferase
MRTLLVSSDFPPDVGGVQTYALEIAKRLNEDGELTVVTPARPNRVDQKEVATFDRTLPFSVQRCTGPRDLFGASAWQRAKRLPPHDLVLHTFWHSAVGWPSQRKRSPSLQCIAAHGRELLLAPFARAKLLQHVYDKLRRRVLVDADLLLPVSHYTASLLQRLGAAPERIRVLPNGTDIERFAPRSTQAARKALGLDPDPLLLLSVGRLMPHKGFDTTIESLPALRKRFGGLKYLICGSGPDQARLESLTTRLGLGDCVRLVGRVSDQDLPTWYDACDVYVMPSRVEMPAFEGFGLSFIEASASGKPVVGARAGGSADAVVDGETGFLVEPSDPQALSDALANLLEDEPTRTRIGAAGRAFVERERTWAALHQSLLQAISVARKAQTRESLKT